MAKRKLSKLGKASIITCIIGFVVLAIAIFKFSNAESAVTSAAYTFSAVSPVIMQKLFAIGLGLGSLLILAVAAVMALIDRRSKAGP